MADSGKQSLIQLGIENENGLTGQVNADSLAYAKDRAAEMVGKRWVGGELVDNPNAKWVITDATRDELHSLIQQVIAGDLPASELPTAIMNATAFSRQRAELIARTELMAANGQGSLAGYKSAKGIGVQIKKAWEPDEGACTICIANADQGAIELEDKFLSDDDAPPAHPNCECVLVPVVGDDSTTEGH